MRHSLFSFTLLLAATATFVGCKNDDKETELVPIAFSEGLYVVNSGNMYSGITGGLTTHTYGGTTIQDAFSAANSRHLGGTPNDAIVYGSKLYIVCDGENRIEVVDPTSIVASKAISTTELLGENEGVSPRHIIGAEGCIYVTTYGGYVAAIDTTDYHLAAKYKVGSYPEGLVYAGDRIFVANSSYGNAQEPSLCYIRLSDGHISFFTNELIQNPSTLLLLNGALYVMEGDVYDWETWAVKSMGGLRRVAQNQVERIYDGSMAMGANQMAAYKNRIYMIKDAYTAPVCVVYDTETKTTSEMHLEGLVAANAINIDPVTGDIIVLSYQQSSEVSEYTQADYNAPGFACRYDNNGTLIEKFNVGVGPTAITFKTGVKWEVKD